MSDIITFQGQLRFDSCYTKDAFGKLSSIILPVSVLHVNDDADNLILGDLKKFDAFSARPLLNQISQEITLPRGVYLELDLPKDVLENRLSQFTSPHYNNDYPNISGIDKIKIIAYRSRDGDVPNYSPENRRILAEYLCDPI